MITIWQAKSFQTRKNNLEKYKAPFQWLIIMNVPNWFCEFDIFRNTVEFCRQYDVSENLLYPQVSVKPHEMSSHPSIISAKETNVLFWKSWGFYLNTEWGLWYIPEPKILYITLREEIIWWKCVFKKHHWKITTLCVKHHA